MARESNPVLKLELTLREVSVLAMGLLTLEMMHDHPDSPINPKMVKEAKSLARRLERLMGVRDSKGNLLMPKRVKEN